MSQLCLVSTLHGGVMLAASIDEGLLPAPTAGERVLLAHNAAVAPELATPWHTLPAAQPVLARFDRVIYLNDDLSPFHPSAWVATNEELPLLNRALRSHWRLGDDPLELVVDSLHTSPAATLARVFHNALVWVTAAGLAGYGPTRFSQPLMVAQRLERLLYLDIVSDVRPLLLREHRIDSVPVPIDSYRRVIDQMVERARRDGGAPLPDLSDQPTTLVLGQRLSALGVISVEEDVSLAVTAIETALESGSERVAFKPHPAAPPAFTHLLANRVRQRGANVLMLSDPYPAEMIAAVGNLHSAVSCYSTALLVLRAAYGVTPISVGTELLFERLTPYQDSDRVPVSIVHALTREAELYRDPEKLQQLLEMIGYCMQPRICADLRPVAQKVLANMPDATRGLYVKRRRLMSMNLPGGTLPAKDSSATKPAAPRGLGRLRGLWGSRESVRDVTDEQ